MTLRRLEDLKKIPFTSRKDLMENYPYGMFAVPLRDVVRLQFPLGLYGNPIVIGYTRKDLEIWRELVARIMVGIGITEHDIIQVAFNYGLFLGAIRFNQSAELIGAAVVPTSIASAEVQLRIMRGLPQHRAGLDPLFCPAHLGNHAERRGLTPRSLSLKIGLLGAEPWPEEVQRILEENLGIKAYDIYGVMELVEPGVAGECMAKAGSPHLRGSFPSGGHRSGHRERSGTRAGGGTGPHDPDHQRLSPLTLSDERYNCPSPRTLFLRPDAGQNGQGFKEGG